MLIKSHTVNVAASLGPYPLAQTPAHDSVLKAGPKSIGTCTFGKPNSVLNGHDFPRAARSCFTFAEGHCWERDEQKSLANAIMYERRIGLSCEQCVKACGDTWTATGGVPYRYPIGGETDQIRINGGPTEGPRRRFCRSVVYDYRLELCDLFDVTGTEYGQHYSFTDGQRYKLVDFEARDFFR